MALKRRRSGVITGGIVLGATARLAAQGPPPVPVVPPAVGGTAITCGPFAAGYVAGRIVKAATPDGTSKAGAVLAGAATGAAVGAALGSIIPGVGTAAGAVIGGLFGAIGGWFGAS